MSMLGKTAWNKGMKMGDMARPKKLWNQYFCQQCGKPGNAYPSEKRKYCSPSCRSKYTQARERNPHLGKKLSPEHRLKLSISHIGIQKGEKHPCWRGGKHKTERRRIMASGAYKNWRIAVFKRDGDKCVLCGKDEGPFEADHIKPFATHPELRFDISNGRVVCRPCHVSLPTHGWLVRRELLKNV